MKYFYLLFLIPMLAGAQTRTVNVKPDGTLVAGVTNFFYANSNLLNASVSSASGVSQANNIFTAPTLLGVVTSTNLDARFSGTNAALLAYNVAMSNALSSRINAAAGTNTFDGSFFAAQGSNIFAKAGGTLTNLTTRILSNVGNFTVTGNSTLGPSAINSDGSASFGASADLLIDANGHITTNFKLDAQLSVAGASYLSGANVTNTIDFWDNGADHFIASVGTREWMDWNPTLPQDVTLLAGYTNALLMLAGNVPVINITRDGMFPADLSQPASFGNSANQFSNGYIRLLYASNVTIRGLDVQLQIGTNNTSASNQQTALVAFTNTLNTVSNAQYSGSNNLSTLIGANLTALNIVSNRASGISTNGGSGTGNVFTAATLLNPTNSGTVTISGTGAGGISLFGTNGSNSFRFEANAQQGSNIVHWGPTNLVNGVQVVEVINGNTGQVRFVTLTQGQYLTWNGTSHVASNLPPSSGGSGSITAGTNLNAATGQIYAGTNAAGQIQFNTLATAGGLSLSSNGNALTITQSSTNQPVITQTNFDLNTAYVNNSGTLRLLNGTVYMVTAAVNGDCSLDLLADQNGGTSYTVISRVAIATLLTGGLALPTTNNIFGVVSNGARYYFTNSSSGAGNSAGIVAGTGMITTLGSGVGSGGTPGGSANQLQFNSAGIFGGLSNPTSGRGQFMIYNGTNQWWTGGNVDHWRQRWCGTGTAGSEGWAAGFANGGTAVFAAAAVGFPFSCDYRVFPTNTSSYSVNGNGSGSTHYMVHGSNSEEFVEHLMKVDTAPTANTTNTYNLIFGLNDVSTTAAPANGVYFQASTNSANWECVTAVSSVYSTNTGTGVAVTVSRWTRLGIEWQANSNVVFYVNGTSIYTNSTISTIPSGVGLSLRQRIVSSNAGGTATSINAYFAWVDYYYNYGGLEP